MQRTNPCTPSTARGVGAAGAGGGTVDALLDAAQERVAINTRRLRMRPDHFLNSHGLSFSFERAPLTSSGGPGLSQLCDRDESGEPIDRLRLESVSRAAVVAPVRR
jgi:hypothetical protein